MSFSLEVKQELSRFETKNTCCVKTECYGSWLFTKCFSPLESAFISESGEAVRKMADMIAQICGVIPEVNFLMSRRKKTSYRLTLPDSKDREKMIRAFGHSPNEVTLQINNSNFPDSCCCSSFLRGAFLSCGIISDPSRGYHMEFTNLHRTLAEDLCLFIRKLDGFSIRSQVGVRKGNHYVYIKESEQCEELLTYIGASHAAMKLMQVKMYKEVKNNINRRSNCETANMDKTYSASAKQIAAIARIVDAGLLEELPENQKKLAEMRLENPEMSLRDLALVLGDTRSGVNYRIKKIMDIAEKIECV